MSIETATPGRIQQVYCCEEFDKILGANVCLYFTSEDCFKCKLFAPKLHEFAADHVQVKFVSVDVDETLALADRFNISTLPTLVLLKQGREVHRLEGIPQQRPLRKLSLAVRQHLYEEPGLTLPERSGAANRGQG